MPLMPKPSPFLTAEWRKLAIVNYAIEPSVLKSFLPFGTELDLWKDTCYVSLVAFRFVDVRVRQIKIPFHTNFEEINLRFYIKYKEGNEWRRGVTFIKEIVPRRAISLVANYIYNEKYVTLPTSSTWELGHEHNKISYKWKHGGKWDHLSMITDPTPVEILVGSEEEFITEHYWGATRVNPKKTSFYQVEHPRWQVFPVRNCEVDVRFGKLYGSSFAFLDRARPDSVMLAEGSKIVVRKAI